MVKFSANLGFLWQGVDLCHATRTAANSGFDAVECHWPYDAPTANVLKTLEELDIPLLALNTFPGDRSRGEFGISAVPGCEIRARRFIDDAIEYANKTECRNIHVMAGITNGSSKAWKTYKENLGYACDRALQYNIGVLIEPLNHRDVPGYHLYKVEDAVNTIKELGLHNLKIMFDCYHTQIMQGNIIRRAYENLEYIEHIQIASVPGRCEPDQGELNYVEILREIYKMGFTGFIGAEYLPTGATEDGLGWLNKIKASI